MILSSSIISANFLNLKQDLQQVYSAGVDWLHIDVMDGAFVPNITVGPLILPFCKKATGMPLDVHLMINHPENHIETFAQAGANRLSIHVENNPNIARTLQEIRAMNVAPGVVLNPGTSPHSLDSLLPFVDHVLVMTVNPGFSGQKFMPEMLEKIRAVRNKIEEKNLNVMIEVDGGINKETVSSVVSAGADIIVAATAIFGYPQGIKAGVDALRRNA